MSLRGEAASGASAAGKPDQHNSRCDSSLSENELSEVLVFGQQKSVLVIRLLENLTILDARIHFGDVEDLETAVANSGDDLCINAFVGEKRKAHEAFWTKG